MVRHSTLRASDADRDAVAARLRQASVEGRLEPHELEERLAAALRARTYGDLAVLVRDLPGTPVARRPQSAVIAPAARMALVTAVRVAVVLAVVSLVAVAIAVTAAWWLICLVFWFALRATRGSCSGRRTRHAGWHRPPHARRV